MKIEKVNDRQIKCTLTSDDLSVRNLNVRELAYGTEKVRNLFSEMMERAFSEVGFDSEGIPLMIEAIPCRDEGIILLITKVEDPEEVDARFARFSPEPEETRNPVEMLASMVTSGVPGIQNPLAPTPKLVPEGAAGIQRAFVFANLDTAIEAAKALDGIFEGENRLYKNSQNGEYYLYIKDAGNDEALYASTCNVLSEYAKVSLHNSQGISYMEEHYELIIKKDALRALAQI
ncbi:MAG: adaptor protein MecA [Lachnospiraceae bacterium]|nr:adaptor protein MecA [Candidatus Darwinimomas equi]